MRGMKREGRVCNEREERNGKGKWRMKRKEKLKMIGGGGQWYNGRSMEGEW